MPLGRITARPVTPKNSASVILFLALIVFSANAWAGSAEEQIQAAVETKKKATPLDLFEVESSYVFASELTRERDFGKQYEFQTSVAYGHRFHLDGNLYLHLGASYERFNFGQTSAPVPTKLQSISGVVGLDYMHGEDVGAFISLKPGFYTESDFDSSSFDIPITLGRIFILQQDKLYLFVGANAAFLRGRYPVLPLAGMIWMPNEKVKVLGILPEPRVIYSPSDKLDLWVGGEFSGGSFRTDRHDEIVPQKLSNAQVDYSDYRAGVGLIYSPSEAISLDLGGGCSIQRSFDFHRAGQEYKTDPAPYVRIEFKARW